MMEIEDHRKLRIGAILPHVLLFGGVRRYVELGNEFTARGHSFAIYTPEGCGPDWFEFRGESRRLSSIGEPHHDVMMCGSPELLEHLERARAGMKVFYLQLEGITGEREIVGSGRYRIMTNSTGLARRVRKLYGIEALDGRGGVNTGLFRPVPGGGRARSGTFRILCYGRMSRPRKGTRFVIDAARWMSKRGYDVELQLFDAVRPGEPDPRMGFDPGIPYRYYLNLPQSSMASMYGGADVFVSAEHRAGWSNTAAEAAACGLPIICTRSGTEDFAVDGVSAIVVSGRYSNFLRKPMVKIYEDPDLAGRLRAEARNRIMEFTWERVVDRMERIFRENKPAG